MRYLLFLIIFTNQRVNYFFKIKYLNLRLNVKENGMNELERTALNEILRTVTYIAEKLDELDSKISLNDSQLRKELESE